MTRIYLPQAQAPNLVFYPAPKPNGHGILIIPGGGYATVVLDGEGSDAVQFFNDRGWHAWVLEYSTTLNAPAPLYPKPIIEALEAVTQIRAQGVLTTGKLGVVGFSAGAHLASLLSTNNYNLDPSTSNGTLQRNRHVDFGILAYGVISMETPAAHLPSRDRLLGPDPSPELARSVSPQYLVNGRTPPVFLFHTANDPVVKAQNALVFASAMADAGRPFELLVLPDGPHGVHLGVDGPKVAWQDILNRWLGQHILS
ncbi:Alpha/Beta hydrolase protein [Microdochium trichocladiopsis]|uniref:Alpha/Beta hydrolase protein n=1 Tax=Microdochium trichocladiopsis TaxID=1682393 RepID=A0A9P8XW40_9PEZI|nr:Alpha/Beta hydrolase protein [Microdochium trichocladiopsis]KAH7021229.1 Alpha/Beta hydrolase protein [Microdochium trichocladiopsis]